jgi:pyrimidine-specific ribonucleoside hydrolase
MLAACGGGPSPGTSQPPSAAPSPGASTRPIVIDTDLGLDDLMALAVLLRDETVRVEAVTVAATGLSHCEAGLRNLEMILHQLGSDGVPIGCGREQPNPGGRTYPDDWRAAADNAYGMHLEGPADAPSSGTSTEVLAAAIDASADPVTLVELGPWTNVDDLFAAHPALISQVGVIHAMGGTLDAPGNVYDDQGAPIDPSLEWNLAVDPVAFDHVLSSGAPIRLVSLDSTQRLPITQALYDALTADNTAAGANLVFELVTLNPYVLQGGYYLWDPLAALALRDPDLVAYERTSVSVSLDPEDAGHLFRDPAGTEIEVTSDVAKASAQDAFVAALTSGGPRPDPFRITGTVTASWDGTSCTFDEPFSGPQGAYTFAATNRGPTPAAVVIVSPGADHTWDDMLAVAAALNSGAPEADPTWIIVLAVAGMDAGGSTSVVAPIYQDSIGLVCVSQDGPVEHYYVGDTVEVLP